MTPLAAQEGRICVFACRWCSLPGAERAGRERLPLPTRLRVVPVACAGSVSADMVIAALAAGAAGVAVLGCHLGGCRHNDANRDAHARLLMLAELLDAIGLDRRRLFISWGTAHEAEQYARQMHAFAALLDSLPSPSEAGEHSAPSGRFRKEPFLKPTAHPAPSPEENRALRARAARVLAEPGHAVFGLRKTAAGLVPALFTTASGLETLVAGPKYPLAKTFARILRDRMAEARADAPDTADAALREAVREAFPTGIPHIACRACDARALLELAAMRRIPADALSFIPIPCSPEQMAACGCDRPDWPEDMPSGDETFSAPSPDAANAQAPTELPFSPLDPTLAPDSPDRAERWRAHFMNCVQCHWCRAACPVCVCPTCPLDGDAVQPAGTPPPSALAYHLTRAMHIADKCVGCGACQDACPQGLPLMVLHRAVACGLRNAYGYESGRKRPSPLLRAREETDDAPQWLTGMETPASGTSGGHRA